MVISNDIEVRETGGKPSMGSIRGFVESHSQMTPLKLELLTSVWKLCEMHGLVCRVCECVGHA